jgi:hypothetical protein
MWGTAGRKFGDFALGLLCKGTDGGNPEFIEAQREAMMTYENANRPQRPDGRLPPIPPGSNPPRYPDIERFGKAGYMLAALGALLVLIAVVMWPGPADRQAADNSPITTTGIGGPDNAPPPIRKR